MILKLPIYVALASLTLTSCRPYRYVEHHCIVTYKGVRPKYVGSDPAYWIMQTCPGVYGGQPWAQDLPYAEWSHVQPNDQRTVTVREP